MNHREIATTFLQMCARGEVAEAFERFVAQGFIHHNPWFPGDRASLLRAMEEAAIAEPNKAFDVKQVIDGGDRVAVLSHLTRVDADSDHAVVHIARFDDGKIVELWDLVQEIPNDTPNRLGMF